MQRKNSRTNSQMQMEDVLAMVKSGMTNAEIAAHYQTTRDAVSRCLNPKPQKGCTLRMTYMYKNRPCTLIDVNFLNQNIHIQNRTDDMLRRAFGAIEKPTWEDFEYFVRDRCFPATRGNAEQLLEHLSLTDYDPLQIVEKTQGRMAEDHMWLKFKYYPRKGKRRDKQH